MKKLLSLALVGVLLASRHAAARQRGSGAAGSAVAGPAA